MIVNGVGGGFDWQVHNFSCFYKDEQEMGEIADFTAKHYKQLAIMYYVVSDDVKIVKYDSKTFRRVKDVPHFC